MHTESGHQNFATWYSSKGKMPCFAIYCVSAQNDHHCVWNPLQAEFHHFSSNILLLYCLSCRWFLMLVVDVTCRIYDMTKHATFRNNNGRNVEFRLGDGREDTEHIGDGFVETSNVFSMHDRFCWTIPIWQCLDMSNDAMKGSMQMFSANCPCMCPVVSFLSYILNLVIQVPTKECQVSALVAHFVFYCW